MHDTVFANQIFSVLKSKFTKDTIGKAISVKVKLSPLSHVTKESLFNAYRELVKESGFEHIRLDIEPLDLKLRCHNCKNDSTVSKVVFKCPHCGSQEIELDFDKEFFVESIDVNS
ncbi:MAG: hydrogenase maturation nickel metallochaperone HypA [Candidatus Omnitrophica bacterium]|nr:hydrogenase maturation nickel metallochaperone HypA [Candidatus Omnitrophota bacterium]